jgi:hypothetical protein
VKPHVARYLHDQFRRGNYWSVLPLLNQRCSNVRQKRLLVGSDRLAGVVISQRFLIAFWAAGHEPIQFIFDFCPIPIVHRCLCPAVPMPAVYLNSTGAPLDIEFVVNNQIPGRSAHARWRAFVPASLIRNSSILRPDFTAATSHLGRLPRPDQVSEV